MFVLTIECLQSKKVFRKAKHSSGTVPSYVLRHSLGVRLYCKEEKINKITFLYKFMLILIYYYLLLIYAYIFLNSEFIKGLFLKIGN